MNRVPHHEILRTRRDFLSRAGAGFGGLALASMLGDSKVMAALGGPQGSILNPLAPKLTDAIGTAKRVIFLFLSLIHI